MADLSDVEAALATLITGYMYPNGAQDLTNIALVTGLIAGDIPPSAVGLPVRIYPGWPQSAQLDSDLRNRIVNISVWPGEKEKNVTRHRFNTVKELKRNVATITGTVAFPAKTVTLGGSVGPSQNVTVIVNGIAYTYTTIGTETLAQIATTLAALINANISASAVGSVITIAGGAYHLVCNIGVVGTVVQLLREQEREFSIDIWAPDPPTRTAVALLVDQLWLNDYISFPDGSAGKLTYERTREIDETQKELCYRRNICCTVEYSTIITYPATSVTAIQLSLESGVGANQGDDRTEQLVIDGAKSLG